MDFSKDNGRNYQDEGHSLPKRLEPDPFVLQDIFQERRRNETRDVCSPLLKAVKEKMVAENNFEECVFDVSMIEDQRLKNHATVSTDEVINFFPVFRVSARIKAYRDGDKVMFRLVITPDDI